jgi:hypothetical protein
MNRREAILTGMAGLAAVAVSPAARAQTTGADNPELEPIRALLDAHDAAFANHDVDGVMACMSENGLRTRANLVGSGRDQSRPSAVI